VSATGTSLTINCASFVWHVSKNADFTVDDDRYYILKYCGSFMVSMDYARNRNNHWPNVDPLQLPYLLDFFCQVCVFINFDCIYIQLEISFTAVLIILIPFLCLGVGIATAYGLDTRDSIPGRDKIFLCSTASRPTLGPNHPPIQCEPQGDFPGNKEAGA
jgi:hypothetical protein